MTVDISVQLCTYNRRDTVLRCVDALSRVTFDPSRFEVVIVDDGSTDGSAEALESASMPCRLLVLRQSHAGLAAGRNTGIRAATGEVVLFVDDDTLADPALVQEHWRTHRAHGPAVVSGGVCHVPSHDSRAGRVRLSDLSTSFFWTTNVSVSRQSLLDAGLFDEEFTEYGWEDLELGDRLRALGLARRRNARALVRHVKPAPSGRDLPGMLARAEASGRSAVLYVTKQPTLRARLATGLTPGRRRVFAALGRLDPHLTAFVERVQDAPLTRAGRLAAAVLCGAAYYRSAERAMRERRPAQPANRPHGGP